MVVDFKYPSTEMAADGQPSKKYKPDTYVDPMAEVAENQQIGEGLDLAARENAQVHERPYGTFEHRPYPAKNPAVDTGSNRRVAPDEDLVIVAHGKSIGKKSAQGGMAPMEMANFILQLLPPGNRDAYTGTIDLMGCQTARPTLRDMPFGEEVLSILKVAGYTHAQVKGYRGVLHGGYFNSGTLEINSGYYITGWRLFEKTLDLSPSNQTIPASRDHFADQLNGPLLRKMVTRNPTGITFT